MIGAINIIQPESACEIEAIVAVILIDGSQSYRKIGATVRKQYFASGQGRKKLNAVELIVEIEFIEVQLTVIQPNIDSRA